MNLRLYFLGPPRLELDGQIIELDTRKATALLAYIVLSGQTPTRDALAALFWPELDESRARAGLRRTLSPLRQALGASILQISRNSVGLQPDAGYWLDVAEFEAVLAQTRRHSHPPADVCPDCLPQLRRAVELYRDDFLAGFGLRDAPEFDEWQFFEAERLRRLLTGALDRLVRGLAAQGDLPGALAVAHRRLALDLLYELAHRQLMQLYAWSGQRNAALRQYRECVRVLEQELGVPPLPETTAVYEQILNGQLEPAPAPIPARDLTTPIAPPAVPPTAAAPATLPFVGRVPEWASLRARYAAAQDRGQVVVLEGEAGVGKTRLAEEFLASVRAGGGLAIAARGYEGEADLAFAPFVALLRAAPAGWLAEQPGHRLAELARLLPELGESAPEWPPAPLDGPGAQRRFYDAVSQALLALLAGTPSGALLIDDLQWADDDSLDLLTYLVRRLSGSRGLILASWRREAVPPGHRLHALLADAHQAGYGERLPLHRLAAAEVAELLDRLAAAGRDVDPGEAVTLYQESEGLPFFIAAYLRAPAEGETAAGQSPGRPAALPRDVRDLLQARLAAVDDLSRQLLHTAAAIGRSFAFEILRLASGRSEEETVAGLETLLQRGLIREMGDDGPATSSPRYDFNHDKIRELVYETTSLARRRLLHGRIAAALAEAASRRRHGAGEAVAAGAAQIAYHFERAGQEEAAASYHRLAGERARALFANGAALRHFEAALALGHPAAAELHAAAGDLLTLDGDYEGAIRRYETAVALTDPAPDAVPHLAELAHKLGDVHARLGNWATAVTHFQNALAALAEADGDDGEDQAASRARILTDWSLTAHRQGELAEAGALALQALALAESAGDMLALAQAHNSLGVLARHQGQPDTARRHLERSLDLARQINHPAAQAAALNNLALAIQDPADPAPAQALLAAALELCLATGDRHRAAALHNNLADLLYAAGQEAAAMDHLKQAVAIYAEVDRELGERQPEIWKLTEW